MLKGTELLRDLQTALKCTPGDLSEALVQQSSEKMGELLTMVVNTIGKEFQQIKSYTEKTLKVVIHDFNIADAIKSESFDAKSVSDACADIRVQSFYFLCINCKPCLVAASEYLKKLLAFCNTNGPECPHFSSAVALTEAALKDIQLFTHGSLENISGLTYVGHIVGTLTLAQSMLRDLKTGETRQTLCHRALQGVQKRGFLCAEGVVKKVEAIISGKPAK